MPDTLGSAVTFGLPLMLAVVVGDRIGSLLVLKGLPRQTASWLTAAHTTWVGGRLRLEL